MQYRLRTAEDAVTLTVETGENGALRVTDGTHRRDVRYARISDHQLHIVVDGVQVNAFVTGQDGNKVVVIRGISSQVQDADQTERTATRRKDPRAPAREVTPPMPSVVERLMVTEGDLVRTGVGLVVVSAMKMEVTLTAPFNGRVTKINVSVGDKVMPGQILVDIAREAAGADEAG